MNLKYIFFPKPTSKESTMLSRLGMVLYWTGIIWTVGLFVVLVLTMSNEGYWSKFPVWLGTIFSAGAITMLYGFPGFLLGRGLLFILANR